MKYLKESESVMQAQLYEMLFSLLALGFSLTFSYTTKAFKEEDYFVFEGSAQNLPPDPCSGLVRTTTLHGPVSPIMCGSECLLTPGCSRFFMEQSGDECFNCTLADKSVDWQPTISSGGITVYSKKCNNSQPVSRPTDCQELREAGNDSSGFYTIYPDTTTSINVYCDMQTDQGGWTVFQRRQDGSTNFFRTWCKYVEGFGDPRKEYWLGNKYLHLLTKGRSCILRIDMVNWDGLSRYAEYRDFRVGNEEDGFTLHIGNYSGNAGHDSLSYHNGMKFSTKDRDQDQYSGNCAVTNTGAWWYNSCQYSNLNGDYSIRDHLGVRWRWYPSSDLMRYTAMKLKCD